MANLIITVIAIALVAIAALMGAYYGGAAFMNNQAAANASTVLNQAQQIAGAWNAYLGDNANVAPATTTALLGNNNVAAGGYLEQIPVVPAGPGGVGAFPMFLASATATVGGASGLHYFAYADVGHPSVPGGSVSDPYATTCVRVQKTALGHAPTSIGTAAQGAIFTLGNSVFGCGVLSGTIGGGLGGATTPSGDLATGDYVFEYLLN